MSTLFHGSPKLFDKFDLSNAGKGTGIRFGFGVYLTESEASAIHYSQPRNIDLVNNHYLYTVKIPELTEDNHLTSALPVAASIVSRVEEKLGVEAPAKVVTAGKEFRKWVGMTLTGEKKSGLPEEKAAAELLDSIGVLYNVWPQAQNKPDGLKNIAVFNAANVHIKKIEHVDVELKCKKWVLVEGSKQIVNKHSVYPLIKEFYPEYDGIQSYPAAECAAFCKTDEDWGVLSNMASTPIVLEGIEFKSAEHIFQMMKFNDEKYARKVWNGKTAKGKHSNNIKMTAKSYEPDHRRADWGSMIVDALKFAMQKKYEQCEAFRNELERSKGKYIVEQQPNPNREADTWSAKLKGDNWVGSNLTGRLLMELRDNNGELGHKLPEDALVFLKWLR